ncbi:hypothetical protein BST81_03565 [Leptolyngbya sp. 'hensonii']|uniref:hypothetical protein n=1 Tax=Leptolyngbya sp. 'hensonii' TaxID=1922337 RepID=UPI00094F737E|nr:hypothetical protein [Leptolyngbya sp. 'hensonii']OLP19821.1 hypothetical protein BST81_03565 [Leptolyngbya sp. 'hensonii']
MQPLSLADIFGASAIQDGTTLTITKADLPGLTPTMNNRAEQLLVGILERLRSRIRGNITSPTGLTLTSPAGSPITFDQSKYYERLDCLYWRVNFRAGQRIDQLIVHCYITPPLAPGTVIAPSQFE